MSALVRRRAARLSSSGEQIFHDGALVRRGSRSYPELVRRGRSYRVSFDAVGSLGAAGRPNVIGLLAVTAPVAYGCASFAGIGISAEPSGRRRRE